jgi:hypothetical protein
LVCGEIRRSLGQGLASAELREKTFFIFKRFVYAPGASLILRSFSNLYVK